MKNLRQQIIADRVDELSSVLGLREDDAFMRLAFSLVTRRSVHAFDPEDAVDGGQDKQMDLIIIDEQDDSADVYIIQTKYTNSFSSNVMIQLGNGLRWLFQRARRDLDELANTSLRDKIIEYRAVQSNLGPSNIRVYVYFVTNGDTKTVSEEFVQELRGIRDAFGTDTFESFTIAAIGFDELTHLSKMQERQIRRVDADLKIKYDANNPSLIKYYAQDLQGLVCSVPASEIARLVNDNPDGSVFDLNIRTFLGSRGAVNRDILGTCTNVESSYEFWFLNNGLTIVCDSADPVTDPDNAHIKLKNLQIVNGCQTATTIALAQKNGRLAADVRVLTRIYQTQDPALVDRIVLTTNNQNQISNRNLRANDPIQLDMEKAFGIHGYYYERKPRQFDGESIDISKLYTNEYVGQAYLAIVLRTPSDGRARKYRLWGEFHARIFGGGCVEPYIISAIIASRTAEWLRRSSHMTASDEAERLIAKRGSLFVARIAAHLLRGSDEWRGSSGALAEELRELENAPEKLASVLDRAFSLLTEVIMKSPVHSVEVDRALKSPALDRDIDKRLHSDNPRGHVEGDSE